MLLRYAFWNSHSLTIKFTVSLDPLIMDPLITLASPFNCFKAERLFVNVKTTLLAALALTLMESANAADWAYSVKFDKFDGVEKKLAVLRSDSGTLNRIEIANYSNGVNFAMLSGKDFKCFPDCLIQIKFDDEKPEIYAAKAPHIVASNLVISDYKKFTAHLISARRIEFRVSYHSYGTDILFEGFSAFDPNNWNKARSQKAISDKCKENAVNEDYSVCMNSN